LKKIGGLHDGSRLEQRADAEEVSHMLFGDGTGLRGLFATHPPLLRRIQALEPGFRPEGLERLKAQWLATPPDGLEEDLRLGLASPADHGRLPEAATRIDVTAPMVAAQVAEPDETDYRRADAIVAGLPPELRQLAGRRDGAVPLLLSLLLSRDADVADLQRSEIIARLGLEVAAEA